MLASQLSFCPTATPRTRAERPALDLSVRTVRPSLLDLRFSGDPWVLDQGQGPFAICLGNYPLAWVDGLTLDLPSLNRQLYCLRHRRPRRRSHVERSTSAAHLLPAC